MANITDAFSIERLSINDVVLLVTGNSDPSSGIGYEAPDGSLYLNSTMGNGSVYVKNTTGDTNWSKLWAGALSIAFSSVTSTPTTLSGYGITNALSLTGGTMTGNITMSNSSTINGIPTPVNSNDAVPKNYVDSFVSGILWSSPIIDSNLTGITTVEPSIPLNGDTYIAYGGASYPQTWTGSVSISSGDIVSRTWTNTWQVVKNLTANDRLGICFDEGTPNSTITSITVSSHTLVQNDLIKYISGNPNTGTSWSLPNGYAGSGTTIPSGTTVLVDPSHTSPSSGHTYSYSSSQDKWFEVAGPGSIATGSGVSFSGNILNVTLAPRLTFTSNNIDLSSVGTAGTYNNVTTDGYGRVTSGSTVAYVTSISGSGSTTGLTLSGGPITSSGTLTLGGVLIPTNGGTGLSSIGTASQILGSNTAATALEYKTLTAGSGIVITPTAGSISISTSGSIVNIIRQLITTSYTALSTDSYLGIQHTANITVTLPTGVANKVLYIKDEKGMAGTYTITINPNGSDTIEYQSSVVINLNYTSLMLVFGTTNWSIL